MEDINYFMSERYKNLDSKIAAGLYSVANGEYNNNEKIYVLNDKKLPASFVYSDNLLSKMFDMCIDYSGQMRMLNESDKEADFSLEDIVLDYRYGKKAGILKTIINSVFDVEGIESNYSASEVMKCIERITHGKISFENKNNDSIYYVSQSTFKKIFYETKKEKKMEIQNSGNLYASIKEILNSLILQEGIAEKEELYFDSLNRSNIKNIFIKKEYMKKELIGSIKYDNLDDIYKNILTSSRSFAYIKSRELCKIYEHRIKELIADEDFDYAKFLKDNIEKITIDPLERAGNLFSQNPFGLTVLFTEPAMLISKDYNNADVFASMVFESIANSDSNHEPLTLKKIRDILENPENENLKFDYQMNLPFYISALNN